MSLPGVWSRLIGFCTQRGIDPVTYMQWCFDRAFLDRAPEPNQLLSSTLADQFVQALQEAGKEVEIAYRIQQRVAETNIMLCVHGGQRTPEDAWAEVLLDEGLALSALYRYCLARSIGGERFERIALTYRAAAARQYRRHHTDYDRTWGGWIPRDLAQQEDT